MKAEPSVLKDYVLSKKISSQLERLPIPSRLDFAAAILQFKTPRNRHASFSKLTAWSTDSTVQRYLPILEIPKHHHANHMNHTPPNPAGPISDTVAC
jgi:hypothetical protein